MAHKITAFRCDFKGCKKYGLNKSHIQEHEKYCFFNPIKKACISCIHNVQEDGEDKYGRYFRFRYCDINKSGSEWLIYPGRKNVLRRNCNFWGGVK